MKFGPSSFYPFLLFSLILSQAQAQVTDWFMSKTIAYRQILDDQAPDPPTAWLIEIGVETENPGDATIAVISGGGIAGSLSFTFDDGEWVIDKSYESEAALNAEFPNNSNYTITLSGGTLGTLTQNFTLGAANYPNVPYLDQHHFSLIQSVNTTADFTLGWVLPDGNTTGISLEINDPDTGEEVVEFEIDQAVLPKTQLITANSLTPGHCYSTDLDFINTQTVSGAAGFGTEGFLDHGRLVNFDIQTELALNPAPIVGAWQFGDGASDASGILIFQRNGTYFHAEDVPGTAEEFDGMERGTYSWASENGILTVFIDTDTNGEIGLSHPQGDFTVTVDGEALMISDDSGSTTLTRVGFSTDNPAIGGWRLCDNADSNIGALVFLPNGTYFHVEVSEPGDPDGADGMERGTYTFNQTNDLGHSDWALIGTPAVDTNLQLGLSHPLETFVATAPGPRILSFTDGETARLHRISNATVMPQWRLNKARSFNQESANTQPTTAIFWDVFASIDTRNASDAAFITLSGGNIAGSPSFQQEDPGEWTFEKDFNSQALLDAEFPDSQTYTITISGGELGTMVQEINIGNEAYPSVPFLTGSNFTDAKNIDPTQIFPVAWNDPGNASVQLVISEMPDEEGEEFFDRQLFDGDKTGLEIPALTLPAGQNAFGYLEFARTSTSVNGTGGFGVPGFSGRQSITQDIPMNAQGGTQLVENAAALAGLTGTDVEAFATPFADGLENLLKFAFNMDLSAQDNSTLTPGTGNSGLPAFMIANDGDEAVIRIEFVRRKGAGLTYTAKRSTTLEADSFLPMSGSVTVTPIDDQFERVVVEEPCNPATIPRCFGIVEITTP